MPNSHKNNYYWPFPKLERLRYLTFIRTSTCTCTPTHMYTHTHTYVHTHVHTYTHMYVHTCTHIHMYTHMYTHTHTRMYTHMYTHTNTHLYYTYVHTYTHIHTRVNTQRSMWPATHVALLIQSCTRKLAYSSYNVKHVGLAAPYRVSSLGFRPSPRATAHRWEEWTRKNNAHQTLKNINLHFLYSFVKLANCFWLWWYLPHC